MDPVGSLQDTLSHLSTPLYTAPLPSGPIHLTTLTGSPAAGSLTRGLGLLSVGLRTGREPANPAKHTATSTTTSQTTMGLRNQ
jgi:hypothetical protein